MNYRQLEQHVPILAWIHIVIGAIFLLLGLVSFLVLGGLGLFATTGTTEGAFVLFIVGLIVGGFLAITGLAGIVTGWGLLKRKIWARVLALIVAILNIFNVPIGTAIGVYTLYVLLQPEASAYFNGEKEVLP